MAEFRTIIKHGYEEVALWRDQDVGIEAICAIHSTALGPAIGGTRWQPYADRDAAFADVLRLSEAMTLKSSAARLPFGGGKAVVIGDPANKTEAQLRSYAEFVNAFEGRYLTTTDVGTTTDEIDQLSQWTPHIVGTSPALGGSGDTSALTAVTVLNGIYATLEALDGDPDPADKTIVVVGVGKVGSRVARSLAEDGARIFVADIRAIAAAALAVEIGANTISVDEAFVAPCDVLSPNALGGVFCEETIPGLQCRAICGGANNQLLRDPQDAGLLAERGILYAPDYVVNSGGVISVAQEVAGWTYEQAVEHAEGVFETTREIFEAADRRKITTAQSARDFALSQIPAPAS
ncbi:MAG: leucine dehydrogenase [Chloroflexi bacterium]|nr:leucine dehydrogenase [Chloroflexota bacterium]MCY3587385.1 leucine dehydrogenase [Chloroflexota bacterium]MDE2707513.1 leucine dehydrogenase [Chloroflexota bacterium]